MIYSLDPSECIDTGKTWPVYTVRLHALGHRAYLGIHMAYFIVRATSKGPLGARLGYTCMLYMYACMIVCLVVCNGNQKSGRLAKQQVQLAGVQTAKFSLPGFTSYCIYIQRIHL